MRGFVSAAVVIVLIAVALLGVPLTAPASHASSCPFDVGCITAIEHLDHWNGSLASILALALVYLAALSTFALAPALSGRAAWRHIRFRTPARPSLMQELFSSGILNRKEPSFSS